VAEPQHTQPPDSPEAARGDGPWALIAFATFFGMTIPAALVLTGPLQSNGWPPRLLLFLAAAGVVVGWLVRGAAGRAPASPALVGMFLLLGAAVVAFVAAGRRVLDPIESAGTVRALLVMVPLAIVGAAIAQSATNRQVNLMLQIVVVGAAISALVAVAQYVHPFDYAHLIRLPGTVARADVSGMGARGAFTRVIGASQHPIEFSVICGSVLPVAVHLARFARDGLRRAALWGIVGLLAIAVPMTVSRSGVVVVVISMLLYSVALNWRQRAQLLLLAVAGAAVLRAAIPGLLGTVTSIFTRISTDPSISGRTQDYSIIFRLWGASPVLGRGLGTFRPDVYFFLDNEYLLALVEGGLVLVTAVILFFLLGIASARGAVLRALDEEQRSRAQALVAAITAIGLSGLLFDLFSFAQATLLAFVLVGLAGACWRLSVQHGREAPGALERTRGVPGSYRHRVAVSSGSGKHPSSR
jgi:O-antigen ligase